jgi:hypothetical protein
MVDIRRRHWRMVEAMEVEEQQEEYKLMRQDDGMGLALKTSISLLNSSSCLPK